MKISLYNYSVCHSVPSVDVPILRFNTVKLITYLQLRYQIEVSRISICFFRPIQMRDLMRRFKPEKDRIADVLSFVEDENSKKISGDIAICIDRVHRDAQQDKISFKKYLQEIILHGILHLFGLVHGYSKKELEQVRELHRTILESVFMEEELI